MKEKDTKDTKVFDEGVPLDVKRSCWNCGGPLDKKPDELVLEISRPGVGRQQQRVPLCPKCGEFFGKE